MTPCTERYMSELTKLKPMTHDEELELLDCGDDGRIREQLVNRNLRFAVKVARQYLHTGYPFEDLISAANEGLILATDKFDRDAGVRFISYAIWWIRMAIRKELAMRGSTVRRPLNVTWLLKDAYDAKGMFDKDGVRPTDDEMAEAIGVTVTRYRNIMYDAARIHCRLDEPYGNLDRATPFTLGDMIAADDAAPPDEDAHWAVAGELLSDALGKLGKRERHILTECVMGDRTMQDVATNDLHICRERVRQLKKKGLADLKELLSRSKRRHAVA